MSFCPVPEEQQPLNEFKALQSSWFFKWALASWPAFLARIVVIWGMGMLIAAPVTAASFPPHKFLGHFLIMAMTTATVPVWIALLHLYLSWRYIGDRLQRDTISYEESGWFDGQLWQKPDNVLTRDCLIVTYQLQPFLHRMEKVFLSLISVIGLGVVLWRWL
jgi:hypothetical protein